MSETGCFCGRCVPNDIPKDPWRTACARCGQEVRFGVINGVKAWHHREPVDHMATLGHSPLNVGPAAEVEPEKTEEEIAHEALQSAKVEVYAHDADPDEFSAQSGIKQIYNLVTGVTRKSPTTGKASKSLKHPPMAEGWELVNLHHARGPYKGSKGEVLSISDTHVLRARRPRLDGSVDVAVASWRDLSFDFAFIGTIKDGRLSPRKVGSDELKNWIKGIDVTNESTEA